MLASDAPISISDSGEGGFAADFADQEIRATVHKVPGNPGVEQFVAIALWQCSESGPEIADGG